MTPDRAEEIFEKTLQDRKLSRSERKVLHELFAESAQDVDRRAAYRDRAFRAALDEVRDPAVRQLLGWLKDVVGVLEAPPPQTAPSVADVAFAPGDDCREMIQRQLEDATKSVDICVFTITDNRITKVIERAHRRGVRVRIISDDDKARDRGSDIVDLSKAGLRVAFDRDEAHMHHKFAIFDRELVLTGSYNWTRSAASENYENLLATDDPRLVAAFQGEFDRLWQMFRQE